MGMKNYSSIGYLLPARNIIQLLPESIQTEYEQLIDNRECELLQHFLDEHWPKTLPPIQSVFKMDDDAEFDDDILEHGEIYIDFAEADLFVKTPTSNMKELTANGLTPTFCQWVDFA
jgi:hypothetical protein